MKRVAQSHENFSCLPSYHQQLLHDFLPNLERLKAAIDVNYEFVDKLLKSAQGMFVNSDVADSPPCGRGDNCKEYSVSDSRLCSHIPSGFDMEKVKTTLKQFYRDWSAEV